MKIKRNPDKARVEEIIEKIKANDGYCPCKLVKDENTKCICKDFRDMIDKHETGECHCGLYMIE